MGVSGSGKSTIGAMLALRLHWEFADADWFHPPSNVEKMHSGIHIRQAFRDKLLEHKAYVGMHGEDMPEIQNWGWPYKSAADAGD